MGCEVVGPAGHTQDGLDGLRVSTDDLQSRPPLTLVRTFEP